MLWREALWRGVVGKKYGSMWGLVFYKDRLGKFFHCISFEVGVGFMVKFQHDSCCGDQNLKEDFPELFHIVSNKEASVVDYLQNSDDNILWDVTFFRTVQALELESLTSFINLIHSTKLGRSGEDKLCWNPSKCRVFEVESY